MNVHTQITKQPKNLQKNILSEDGTIIFDFMISLENIAIVKIITHLWMDQNILQKIAHSFHHYSGPGYNEFNEEWDKIQESVVVRVSELALPNFVNKKLKNIVELTGNFIIDWIKYHDAFLFKTSELCRFSATDKISNIAWNTRGKIDYAQTAKNMIANCSSLSDDQKYKLACAYCLEDEISVLAPNVISWHYLENVYIDEHPLVYFWTSNITGDNTSLCNPLYYQSLNRRVYKRNQSINENMFQLLTNFQCTGMVMYNEISIRYIWNKLSEEEKAKNVESLIEKLDGYDLKYSLLSSLGVEQQEEFLKKNSINILSNILNNWLWREYVLPIAFRLLNTMDQASFCNILSAVHEKMIKNSQGSNKHTYDECKYIFNQLWRKSSQDLKDLVFQHENSYLFGSFLLSSLSWRQDIDLVELVFNDLNIQQKKNIIFKSKSIMYCAHLIESDQWDLLELFIKHTLLTFEDVSHLKQRLVESHGREIARHFINHEEEDKIEYFLNWALKSEEKINEFRLSLAYINCKDLLNVNRFSSAIDFGKLENHFKWCAKNDLEAINRLKAGILKLNSGGIIFKLVECDNYKLLCDLLNWCLLDDQQVIEQFKSNIFRDDDLKPSIGLLISGIIYFNRSTERIYKFIYWSFSNRQDIQEFRRLILSPEAYSCVCTHFICTSDLKLADEFVECCSSSPEEINNFKKTMMLSRSMIEILSFASELPQSNVQLLIKWFNPSDDTVIKFKKLFSESTCPTNFYKFLDEFICSQRKIKTVLVINTYFRQYKASPSSSEFEKLFSNHSNSGKFFKLLVDNIMKNNEENAVQDSGINQHPCEVATAEFKKSIFETDYCDREKCLEKLNITNLPFKFPGIHSIFQLE